MKFINFDQIRKATSSYFIPELWWIDYRTFKIKYTSENESWISKLIWIDLHCIEFNMDIEHWALSIELSSIIDYIQL